MPASAAEPGILSTAMHGIDSFAQLTGLPWWAVIPLTALGWLCALTSGSDRLHAVLHSMPVSLLALLRLLNTHEQDAACTVICLTWPTAGLHSPAALHGTGLQLGRSLAPLAAWLSIQCLPALLTPASGTAVQAEPHRCRCAGRPLPTERQADPGLAEPDADDGSGDFIWDCIMLHGPRSTKRIAPGIAQMPSACWVNQHLAARTSLCRTASCSCILMP